MEALEEFLSSQCFVTSPVSTKEFVEQSHILEPILNSLAEGLLVADLSGRIILLNTSAKALLGHSDRERIAAIAKLDCPIRKALRGETPENKELCLAHHGHPDGICLEMSTRPIKSKEGHICGAVSVLRDVTKQRKLQEKLSILATIVESSSDAIISGEINGTIRTWNKGAERIFGYSENEMIGREPSVLFMNKETERRFNESVKLVKEGRGDAHYESWHRRRDGKKILLSISVSPIRDAEGNITSGCAILRDITELKKSQDEVKTLARNLARSNEEYKQFAYAASHDLQEPLRVVSSYITLLADRYSIHLDNDAKDFIEFAVDGVSRMRQLIGALLEYSAIELPTSYALVDTQALMEKVKNDLQMTLWESKAILVVDPLPVVFADEIRLGQVFQNLIANAVKFSDGRPDIHVSAIWGETEWVFAFKDNGIGIEPGQAHRIFQIFQKLHGRQQYSGTGIGLAICKKIVEQHGGKIWFEAKPSGGTTFFFTLPRSTGDGRTRLS